MHVPPHGAVLSDSRRNFGLDLVRAVAVGMVVLAHYCEFPFSPLGGYAVDLFFALSGYLIGGILYRQFASGTMTPSGLLVFWKRPWYRTLPNAYLALIAFTAAFWVFSKSWPDGGWKYPFFLQNLAWPMSEFFVVSWSLAIEEWFYLLFPILLLALEQCGVRFGKALIVEVVSFIAVPICLRTIFGYHGDWEHGMGQVVVYRLDALMYGVAMSIVREKLRGHLSMSYYGLAGMGALALMGAVVLHLFGPRPPELRYVVLGIPAHPVVFLTLVPMGFALMLLLSEQCPRPVPWLTLAVQRTSEWSYSVYLWHTLIYGSVRSAFRLDLLSAPAKLGVKLGCLVETLWISRLIYNRFELFFLRKRPSETPTNFPNRVSPHTATT